MASRGFLIFCILMYFHDTIGNVLASNWCSQGCTIEPHINCTVIQDADCSKFSDLTNALWPGAPANFNLINQDDSGNQATSLGWSLPDDASYQRVTGFLLRSTLLQGMQDTVCVHIHLSSTRGLSTDHVKQMTLPWDCTGIPRGKQYYISINSLPLPNDRSLTRNMKGMFVRLPKHDVGSAKNWSPNIGITQQHYTDKPGVKMSVKLNLAPKFGFTRYDIRINGANKDYIRMLRPGGAVNEEVVFEDICEGNYTIEIEPWKRNAVKCTCEGSHFSCNPCLVTRIRIAVNPQIPCTQKPTTITTSVIKVTDSNRSNIHSGLNNSVASPEPMTNGQMQAPTNAAYMVIIIVSVAAGVICFLVLPLVTYVLCKRDQMGKRPTKSTDRIQGESNYGQEADSTQWSVLSPNWSSKFSEAGTENMRQWNDDQSRAYEDSQHYFGNDTKYKTCDIDNVGYAV